MGGSLAWTKGSLGLFPWMQRRWGSAGGNAGGSAGRSGRRLQPETEARSGSLLEEEEEGEEEEMWRRRLEEEEEEGHKEEKWVGALSALIDTFTTLGCALAVVLLLQLLVHLLWKHRLNRRYYALREQMKERKGSKDSRATPEAAAPAARGRCNLFLSTILPTKDRRPIDPASKIKFYPFPGILRWPTLPCFVCVCCLSGLLQSAVTILAAHKTAPLHALVFAFAAVGIAVGVLLLLWTQLLLFARRHLQHMWAPERAPEAPKEVADPALRLVSTVRRHPPPPPPHTPPPPPPLLLPCRCGGGSSRAWPSPRPRCIG